MKNDNNNLKDEKSNELRRDLGFFAIVAIIVGQMIGSGIYMTPQGLAELSNPFVSVVAMLITGVGTIFMAISYSRLNKRGAVTGSIIVYTRDAFGDMPAFWVGWCYWCGCWIANGAIAVAAVSYASYFFPVLAGNNMPQFLAVIGILWFYTLLNLRGVKAAGYFNLIMTIIKLLPLLLFIIIAIKGFDSANLYTVSSDKVKGFQTLPVAAAYCLWCYLGFEGATVTAGEAKNENQIGRATIISSFAVMILYIVIVILSAGAMSQGEIANSTSPLADIMHNITGAYWTGAVVSIGGSLCAFGCVGAWILSAGRASYSLASIDLLPKVFMRTDPKNGSPRAALLINGVLMTIVMAIAYFGKEGTVYNFLVMLSVTSFLVFYLFGVSAEMLLTGKDNKGKGIMNYLKKTIFSILGFIYAMYTIYGSGAEYVFSGFLLLLAGIPFFIAIKLGKEDEEIEEFTTNKLE